jgi:hypothetical protein
MSLRASVFVGPVKALIAVWFLVAAFGASMAGCTTQKTSSAAYPPLDHASQLSAIVAAGAAVQAAQDAPYDPAEFNEKLAEARRPFDKCVDDRIPVFRKKPIADKKVAARLLLGECSSQFQQISDLVYMSPLAKRPAESRKITDGIIDEAQRRAEVALRAP